MRRPQWGWYAVALAILVVGLVWAGGPANILLFGAVLLACPVMMMFMMRGMHGDDTTHRHHSLPRDQRPDDHQRPDDFHGLPRI